MTPFDEPWLQEQLARGRKIIGDTAPRKQPPSAAASSPKATGIHPETGAANRLPPEAQVARERKNPTAPRETEAGFQVAVIEYAHLRGWKVAHFRPARAGKDGQQWITAVGADGKGFPDLVLVRNIVIFAELKSDRGKLRPEQEMWANKLSEAGCPVYCWRPADWPEIRSVLE